MSSISFMKSLPLERKGRHYQVSANSISLFGLQGFREDGQWVMSLPFSQTCEGYMVDLVSPVSVLETLQSILQTAAVQRAAVNRILLSSRIAVCLFLEGRLSAEAFELAEERDEAVWLLFELSGAVYLLEIRSEFALQYDMCLLDRQGVVISNINWRSGEGNGTNS